MAHFVEDLREIGDHHHGAVGVLLLVETYGHFVNQWQQGCGGGALPMESVLEVRHLKLVSEFSESSLSRTFTPRQRREMGL